MRKKIDKINELIYKNIKNGVYCDGLEKKKEEYEEDLKKVLEEIEEMEKKM